MGYTIYFKTEISKWRELEEFLREVCAALGFEIGVQGEQILITPASPAVEPLIIKRRGTSSVKTYRIEPYTALYKMIIYSLCSFGSVEVSED